jgi:hypothetical protein
MNYYNELIGTRFGSLVVAAVNRGAKNVHNTADCICDCGSRCRTRLTRLRNGLATQCRKCGAKATWAARLRPNSSEMAAVRLFHGYMENARRRGIRFELSRAECMALFLLPCAYCGSEPTAIRKARGRDEGAALNGIDRVDNSGGYTSANCEPCCPECNFAKRAMPRDEFIALAIRIARHQS